MTGKNDSNAGDAASKVQVTDSEVEQFLALYQTNTAAHYWFDTRHLAKRVPGQKTEITDRRKNIKMVKGELSADLVRRHLEGAVVLGVAPGV